MTQLCDACYTCCNCTNEKFRTVQIELDLMRKEVTNLREIVRNTLELKKHALL